LLILLLVLFVIILIIIATTFFVFAGLGNPVKLNLAVKTCVFRLLRSTGARYIKTGLKRFLRSEANCCRAVLLMYVI
jgi:hypothetical protein